MPKLTPAQKSRRDEVRKNTTLLINQAGGQAAVWHALRKKHPDLRYNLVQKWYHHHQRVSPEYFWDLISLSDIPPWKIQPDLFNSRHPEFRRWYKRAK